MIEIFKKRSQWCYYDEDGRIHKFNTEQGARASLGFYEGEFFDGDEEKEEDYVEEENYYEEEDDFEEEESETFERISEEDTESESEE